MNLFKSDPCPSCAAHLLVEQALRDTIESQKQTIEQNRVQYEELLRSHMALADRGAYLVRYQPQGTTNPRQPTPAAFPRTSPAALRNQVFRPSEGKDERGLPQGATVFGVVAQQAPVQTVTEEDFTMPIPAPEEKK